MARIRNEPSVAAAAPTEDALLRTFDIAGGDNDQDQKRAPAARGKMLEDSSDEEANVSSTPRRFILKKKTPMTVRRKQITLAPLSASKHLGEVELLPSNERLSRPTPRRFLQLRETPSKPLSSLNEDSSDEESDLLQRKVLGSMSANLRLNLDASDLSVILESKPHGQHQCNQETPSEPCIPESQSEMDDLEKDLQALSMFAASTSLGSPSSLLDSSQGMPPLDSRPGSSSDKENVESVVRFSPPRLYKSQGLSRPSTPPAPESPSKSRLQSPSKRKTRIPTPPGRPSLDMFWASDAVNDWNDQFSPQKVLKSPRKAKQSQDEDLSTPRANKLQSPVKANLKAKKDFDATKQDLAESFLAELDQRITNNKVAELTASTGGVKLIWSKTLTTTAGRANWRRERSTKPSTKADKSTDLQASSDDTSATTTKDHASIELSTKIITDAPRLLNVIAHEFCHLANFLVTGIKDRPHGAEFQRWGRLCTAAFAARGVHVTTKHSYEIEYKYLWRCSGEDCDQEFQRHSRSIDVKRHKCGRCKSTLVQIRPVPRGSAAAGASGGTGNEAAAKGGYAAYVKKHFAEVKAGLPAGSNQKDVMVALGQKYRAEKAESQMTNDTATVSVEGDGDEVEVFVDEANDGAVQVDDLINELEIVTLGDE